MSYLFPSRTITVEAALRDLGDRSTRARALAAHALGDAPAGDADRAVAGLRAALDDDHPQVRTEAAHSLAALAAGDPDTVAALCRRLDDGHPAVRQAAAIALGTLGAAGGFDALAEALTGGPADLRFQAATSLVEIDAARAFDRLVRALDDGDPQVLAAVALALGATEEPRAAEHLAGLLDHPDRGVRFDAAYALAQLGDGRGRDVLLTALTDGERDWDATCALEQLADPGAVPTLAGLLGRRGTSGEVQARAAAAVLRLAEGGPHAAAARLHLVAALRARKATVRGVAVEQLGGVGGAWAVPALEALARRRRGREHGAALSEAVAAIRARTDEPPR